MTNDQKGIEKGIAKIAIAEICGWKRHDVDESGFRCKACGITYNRSYWRIWEIPYLWCLKDGLKTPPDYPNDLNACFDFEESLDEVQQIKYGEQLMHIINAKTKRGATTFGYAHMSAPERCEAFLRLHGKWQDK